MPAPTDNQTIGARLLLVCWLLTAAIFATRAILASGTTPLFLDTDDAMRLTMVHDFLAGQGWWDNIQHRLNAPYGAEIHWSRLIDLPEAAILFVLRPVFGSGADTALAYVWPLLLLLPLLWLSARVAIALGGHTARMPALVLPALSVIVLFEFAPGRLDHHSVQIILALLMVWSAVSVPGRPGFAWVGGIAAGLALAIGIEGLPIAAATILAFGIAWVVGAMQGRALIRFGFAFAAATLLALLQGVPPAEWLAPATDMISIVYVAAAILCAAAFAILARLPLTTWPARLGAGALAGAVVLAILVAAFPHLLAGPYAALDPWLLDNWINRIAEAESWATNFAGEPAYATGVLVPVLTAFVTALVRAARNRAHRARWLTYALFIAIALGMMLLQIRAARIALPLALPGCAVLVGLAWHRMVNGRGILPILATIGAAILSASTATVVAATAVILAFPDYAAATTDNFRAARNACMMPAAYGQLAAMPPARIMAPVDLGSHLLLHTPHAVVGAPYHRNGQGVRDTFHFFNDPLEAQRSILTTRGITLVVICPALKEIRGLVDHTPDSFVSLYATGQLPAWLHEISAPDSPLKIYAVDPA